MKILIVFLFLFSGTHFRSYAQGCATIRNIIGVGQFQPLSNDVIFSRWNLQTEGGLVIMNGGAQLPVSRNKKDTLVSMLLK